MPSATSRLAALGLGALLALSACGRAAGVPGGDLAIELAEQPGGRAIVRVLGLSAAELDAVADADLDAADWQRVLQVTVAGGPPDQPAVVGSYRATDEALEFAPRFGFDPGRQYDVAVDLSGVSGVVRSARATRTLGLPAIDRVASTVVTRILPTAAEWPQNHLRIYVEFSGPMSRTPGLDLVRLLDDGGGEVVDPFLPLDADFWNQDLTRYTLFFDPGRVKQGILPNEAIGRPLEQGREYTIEVDAAWEDEHGLPLVSSYRQTFRVGPPDESPVSPADWVIAPPAAGTRAPLTVRFPSALDHGLLQRAVGVADADGGILDGAITVGPGETEWRFTPDAPWAAGRYDLVVLSILEDLAGNRVGRLFEVDRFDRVDADPAPDRMSLPFEVR